MATTGTVEWGDMGVKSAVRVVPKRTIPQAVQAKSYCRRKEWQGASWSRRTFVVTCVCNASERPRTARNRSAIVTAFPPYCVWFPSENKCIKGEEHPIVREVESSQWVERKKRRARYAERKGDQEKRWGGPNHRKLH